jgi:hypothetical protein
LAAAHRRYAGSGRKHHEPQIEFPGGPAAPITPMVYVKDKTLWEFKLLTRNLSKEKAPSEEELNTLGKEGWEPCRNRHRSSHRSLLFQAVERLRPKHGGNLHHQRSTLDYKSVT